MGKSYFEQENFHTPSKPHPRQRYLVSKNLFDAATVVALEILSYNCSMNLRIAIAFTLVLALAVIGYVLFSQYAQGFRPCELCLKERLPWYGIIGLGLIGLIRPHPLILALIGVLFLVSAGLGGHHAGVEQGWWAGPTACTGGLSGAQSIEQLRAMMQEAQLVRCDEISWKFLKISMAGYNFIVSLAAGILTLAMTARFYRGNDD